VKTSWRETGNKLRYILAVVQNGQPMFDCNCQNFSIFCTAISENKWQT